MAIISVSTLNLLLFFSSILFLNFQFIHSADITYDNKGFIINGQRKILLSGSIHYPRSTPDMWEHLIRKAKVGGLDVIDTYVFWNGHEPSPGKLLARKAPLGQIWMAATMHAKMNRRNLDQINLIRICEEILNPSVPMALRLSGILMGGVVIVYERKVRLLYDDVNRLLVEINTAWKVKPAADPTVLPKRKNKAKFESVTIPENEEVNFGDVEPSIDYSNRYTSSATFQRTAYVAMRLDTIDDFNESFREADLNGHQHQADPANITLNDPFDLLRAEPSFYNRYERFDIEGDEETQNNFPSQGHTEMPPPSVHSPPQEMEIEREDNIRTFFMEDAIPEQNPVDQANSSTPKLREVRQKQRPTRKKARQSPMKMDIENTMILSNMYQTWLQDSTDIVIKRPEIAKVVKEKSTVKLAKLLDLPPVALSCGLVGKYNDVHYPQALLDLWMTTMQPMHDSPSARTSSPRPPEPERSSSSPPNGQDYRIPPEVPIGGFSRGTTSERLATEEIRGILRNLGTGTDVPIQDFNLMPNSVGKTNPNASAPNSGASVRSMSVPSPGPGLDFLSNTSDSYSNRLRRKRSSSQLNNAGLESLDEENQWMHEMGDHNIPEFSELLQSRFKLPKRSRKGLTPPDQELLVETGPTQNRLPAIDEEADRMAYNISMHLKTYFEGLGAPQSESLNQLAYGMNRKQAAQLFYQTCVLATRDILKVQQISAYGDITISRGAKM
ncbi:unnamed protein product [Amaranthus hypochondriacus]